MSTNENTQQPDVYTRVTDQIINAIKRGTDVRPSPAGPPLDQVHEFIRASKAQNTLRGYQSDWRAFCAWAEAHRLCAMPASPETVAAFIAECRRTAEGRERPAEIKRNC